ncbi:carbohydrate ABC transporter permease [Paenibacillus sedimenti]|uniref:Sugar ABC transporter permease n=1 Tax=Paenibacillus sedimenti TaxID=2770274 RepID=A0A926QJP0_9BACL|nr:sugar ABC transporter permease [Paenibacillus sedimenti]MBD0380908.1 sugar ABC transporter permease [Paenibacillus sedimenti]
MWANKKISLELKWLVFLLPALAFYLGFLLIPTLSSAYYSLTDWNGMQSKYIGFSNYIEMFHDKMILTAFRNTIQFTITITILQNFLGLVLALLLVKKFAGVNFMRTLFFMPSIFSTLLIGYVWGFILEPNIGVLNNLLDKLGLSYWQMGWLSNPFWAKWVISLVTSWQFAGYAMVIYIAGLQAIPKDMYECGEIEGATGLKKFIHITFPLIAPSFTINIVLCMIGNLQIFNQIYVLTKGGPGYMTESVASMIYQLGFGPGSSRWGYGSAMSIVLFIFILIVTIAMVTFLRKREVEM